MTNRICIGSAGGSKPRNSTYELLVKAYHKFYENETETIKDVNILP